jgi:hypothetical protein
MRAWAKQLAGAVLVLVFALAVGGFVMVLRAQQSGLAATMAAANIRAVSPPDGATNVPLRGEVRADYVSRPSQDPIIKFEPPVGVALGPGRWEATTFVMPYSGLRENSLYHVELDQDVAGQKGEHKQIKVRWSFRTGLLYGSTPTATPTASARPTATPTISPTSSPPATPDLIWYSGQNGVSGNGNNGIDWNGHHVKALKWVGTLQSPDGRWIYNSMTPSIWIYDADGNRAGSIAGAAPSMWADDSQQFCGIRSQTTPGTVPHQLVTMPLDGSVHTVGPISLLDSASKPVQELSIAACSDLAGRAVVVGGSNGYIWSMAVISLTDGSVIYQTRYPNPLKGLAASHDGRYLAEQQAGNVNGISTTLIRELPSGTAVGRVTGITVVGFSWDGSLVAGGIQANSGFSGAEIIHWQDNQLVWNRCGCPSPFQVRVIAQPGGSKLAIGAFDQQLAGTLTIIDANGAAQSVPVGRPIQPLF